MDRIILVNKTKGFYSEILSNKFKIKFEIYNFYLEDHFDKTENEIIKNINFMIKENDIKFLVAEGDYLSIINFNFIKKIKCDKKILFLTDDYDMHEVNFITAKSFDYVFTACPISNLRYLEKGFKSYFVPLESNKDLFKNFKLDKKFNISFFGVKKSTRDDYIYFLRENNIDVNLMGYDHPPDYNWDNLSKFISSSKIVLNFSNTGNKNKFYSHSTIQHNFYAFKGRPLIVGLCETLCVSEFSPSNEIIFGQNMPTFKNKYELLQICQKLLSDEDYFNNINKNFTKKCFEYEDNVYFKKILEEIHQEKKLIDGSKIKLPFWYIRIFNNQKVRNFSKRKRLMPYLKEIFNIIFFRSNHGNIFNLPILIELLVKFPFIIIKILLNKLRKYKN